MATEKYHVNIDGTDYEFPYFVNVKAGLKADLMEAFAEAETAPHKLYRAMFAVANKYGGKKAEAALKDMESDEFDEFVTKYIKSTPGISGK